MGSSAGRGGTFSDLFGANNVEDGLDVTVSSADLDANGIINVSKANFTKIPLDAYNNAGNSGEVDKVTGKRKVDLLYAYLKGRSDGKVPAGRVRSYEK